MGQSKKRHNIEGLEGAKILDERPPFLSNAAKSHKGSKKEGLIYEAKVASKLKGELGENRVLHGPWVEYKDKLGPGWCSPDLIILPEKTELLIIGECKLTSTRQAPKKLMRIYKPVVQAIYPDYTIRLVQFCKNLKLDWEGVMIKSISEMYHEDKLLDWEFATWNWRNP